MLGRSATSINRKKLALCALLHHASVSSKHEDYLNFYRHLPDFGFGRYTRHTAPGENIALVNNPAAGFSAYWNKNEIMLFFANPTDHTLKFEWSLDAEKMGRPSTGSNALAGKVTLQSLEFKVQKIKG